MTPPTNTPYLELAELAGGFIHEIKNHINTLSLNLQLLAETFDPPETPRERQALDRVRKINTECDDLVKLSNDFLRYARITTPSCTRKSIVPAVERMIDFVMPTARSNNIAIVWHAEPELPAIPIDQELIERGLMNLMLNAMEAMPQGGTLTLQARYDAEANRVILEVIDTGTGMSEGTLRDAFKPFITTKAHGNGLGLATTKKIVDAHGGRISVQSQSAHGTMFTLEFPVAGTP